jgi:hypothetical protein
MRILVLVVLLALPTLSFADIATTPLGGAVTANTMANSLLSGGSGITINSATYTGGNNASGLFSGGASIIGIDTGIIQFRWNQQWTCGFFGTGCAAKR